MTKIILIGIYLFFEMFYVISCIIAIIHIRRNLINSGKGKFLSLAFLGMMIFGMTDTILRLLLRNNAFEHILFITFFVFELLSLYILNESAISNKVINFVNKIFLSICLIYLFKVGIPYNGFISFYGFFVVESLIAGTISLAYFIQISTSISTNNLIDDPLTYIMLALFFCFSLPLSYTSSLYSINLLYPSTFINPVKRDIIPLFFISRIGTICYIVFNLFIIKAMKCKQISLTGHQ